VFDCLGPGSNPQPADVFAFHLEPQVLMDTGRWSELEAAASAVLKVCAPAMGAL
jgi:hypothetical protein